MSVLVPGSRLGHYEILDSLGAGGMGEVYRATDTRLKRQVALKVLPSVVTADPDRLARFQREAEVLASLNHPNIAGLYGIEESPSTHSTHSTGSGQAGSGQARSEHAAVKALVMELVDGPTLAERIAQGPIPIREALAIAAQIADALAAAHEQNVIHRDLKPANVKLRPDGEVKVLDFGLAKAIEPAVGSSPGASMSPTITSPAQMTAAGMILGTAAYMSPEQATGRPVDRRTDLWAFGVVLFEMLSGRRLFDGESVSHVIAGVLKDAPDWTLLPTETPGGIVKLLERCLEKDRRKRLSDAATAAFECEEVLASPRQAAVPASPAGSWSRALLPAGGGVAIGALVTAIVALIAWPTPSLVPYSTRFAIELPAGQIFTRSGRHVLALSPDGRHVVFVANNQLNLRSLNDLTAKPIDGTVDSDPSSPVFSEDGQWIAFWASGRLKKIPVTGGTAIGLADTGNPFGMSWHGDRILIASDHPRAILEVPSGGGQPQTLLELDATKDELAQSPQLIDDGKALLFTLRTGAGTWDGAAIVVHELTTGRRTTLVDGGTDARLVDGRLVYTRDATLFSAPYDPTGPRIVGSAVAVQQRILQSVGGFSGASMVAFSDSGTLAYVPDESFDTQRILLWMSRKGELQPTGLPARPHWGGAYGFALSPDGKRVAMRMVGASGADTDVWIADLDRNSYSRLSFTGSATDPVWTPDGTRVCYEDSDALMCQPFDGSAAATRVFSKSGFSTVAGLSPDASSVLLIVNNPKTGFDLWVAPNRPPFEASPLVEMQGNDSQASLSPDGRWIAYSSEASGVDEIYVRPFPDAGQGRWQVSTSGGVAPRFSRDGRELYYFHSRTAGTSIALTLMAAKVLPGAGFATTPPEALTVMPFGIRGYEPTADGRFLISAPVSAVTPTPEARRQSIVVVQHWREGLQPR